MDDKNSLISKIGQNRKFETKFFLSIKNVMLFKNKLKLFGDINLLHDALFFNYAFFKK